MSDSPQKPPGKPVPPRQPGQGTPPGAQRPVPPRQPTPPPRPADDDATRINTQAGAAPGAPRRPPAGDEATVIAPVTRTQRPGGEDTTSFSPTTGVSRTAGAGMAHAFAETAQLLSDGERIIKSRFVLEKLLGSGGMGSVYKARDLRKVEARDRNPYVAIKILNEDFQKHPDAFISLQREARKSQSLAHPNIVTVYDFDRDGDMVFMTMEFLEGEPLDTRLKSNRKQGIAGLPDEAAFTVTEGMCAALARAHRDNIVHSDFKPGNVFVTNRGEAKVFDFGIARAVARSERHGQASEGDKTVFDAGDLGALTPAYASLEMLNGEEPDPRDDIYALAVVVYQLFTGKHPFDRLPADQAAQKKLKAARPARLSAQQWKAVQRGLAFKRADRTPTVEKFIEEFNYKAPVAAYVAAVFVAVLVGVVIWFAIQGPQIIERERVVERATGVNIDEARLQFQRERIEAVLKQPPFRGNWEDRLYVEYQAWAEMLPADAADLAKVRRQVQELYLPRITQLREGGQLDAAALAIRNAERYGIGAAFADEKSLLATAQEAKRLEDEQRAREQQAAMAQMSEAQRKATEERVARDAQLTQQRLEESRRTSSSQAVTQLQAQIDSVRQKLECPDGNFNIRQVGVAVRNLQALDAATAKSVEPEFTQRLGGCLSTLAQRDPAAAEQNRQLALQLFPNDASLKSLQLGKADACPRSLAGLGARGARATCRDALEGAGEGPRLVVIPGGAGLPVFAIGRQEVSVGEYNAFCRAKGSCSPVGGAADLPVTGVTVQQAEAYTRWLSAASGKAYRLPTQAEWLRAARADGAAPDDNRNCFLDSMGIRKGDALVPADTGKPNAWGLVNHVGNAQEWALADGIGSSVVLALGGAHTDPIGECQVTSQRPHGGAADRVTGFRVLREVR